MGNSRCVSFANQQGNILHGILHEPDPGTARGACVLLLSPGIKGRVGPHRLYLKIAERLAPLGFHVLRFDYHGLGDSEGAVAEHVLADMYNTIHGGRYANDTIAAMDWMQTNYRVGRFVGSGLCGGSISALLTAERDARIECLLGIGLPTVLEGGPENWAIALSQHQIASIRGSYFGKLADPKSLLRLLSGKSNYSAIAKILRQWLAGPKTAADTATTVQPAAVDRTNPRFASAFVSMLESSRAMLLIFSGADRLHAQFAENFESHNQQRIHSSRHLYSVHVIPNANHVLSDPAWVAEMLDVSEHWLAARYPVPCGQTLGDHEQSQPVVG